MTGTVILNDAYFNGERSMLDAAIRTVTNIGDLDGNGVPDLALGMPEADLVRGGIRIVFLDSDLNVMATSKISNAAFGANLDLDSYFGGSIEVIPDINSDGINELLVGAMLHNFYSDKQGAFWIVSLDSGGHLIESSRILRSDLNLSVDADFFARDISYVGLMNGVITFVVSAPTADYGNTNTGSYYVFKLTADTDEQISFSDVFAELGREGESMSYYFTASSSQGINLIYTSTNLPVGATYNSTTGLFTWTPSYDDAGTYTVTLAATDDGEPSLTATTSLTITVLNANRAPILSPVGNQVVAEGQTLSFSLVATDPDGDVLTYAATNLPSGATFSGNTFTWTPDYNDAGNYENIEFSVSDNGSPMELDLELITISVGDVNRPPVLTNPGPQAVLEEDSLSFSLSATDPDGDSTSITATNLPSAATFANGSFNWIPTLSDAGVYTVTFTATDSGSPAESAVIDVVITVGDNPTPTEQAEDLIENVVILDLPTNVENAYMANLQKVGSFIEEGKVQAALNQLQAFINKITQDYNQGVLTNEIYTSLLNAAEQLMEDLGA